ncbi:cation:proton antiporter [Streptomyces microflavus]|uniref:cation:proton antiporter domain-containing protein n=1 Tax=Streptomyces microflavus TaxID=1919 RepID=UPI0036510DD1
MVQRTPLSAPLLALVTGIAPRCWGVLDLPTVSEGHEEVHELSRLLLAISAMAVALRYRFRDVRALTRPVTVLLIGTMAAMAVITTAVLAAALGIGLGAAALLGAALCPTDPVLASSVVSGKPAEKSVFPRTRKAPSARHDPSSPRSL